MEQRIVNATAFENRIRKQFCSDCERRKGIKNGKKKFIYPIGGVPCRACEIDDMLDFIDDEPTVNQWIPVSERLPEDEDVLIQFPSNMAVGRFCGEWRINSGGNWETEICIDDEKPIAWMPLPEPWKGESNETN